jgi:hypothetical protein
VACGVDLEDDAVDLVAERGALGFGLVDEGDHSSTESTQLAMRIDAEAEGGEGVERGGWPCGQYSPSTSRK